MQLALGQIAETVNGTLTPAASADILARGVECDTRRLAAQGLFVALGGTRADGHSYLPAAAAAGAAGALVSRHISDCALPQILTAAPVTALAQLAAAWRQRMDCRIVAITGSNGKTTVKEMLYSIMTAAVGEARCLCSSGNFNNHLGVPLTLLRLEAEHELAAVEAGMDNAGELTQLAALLQPQVVVINNAQRAHIGHFASLTAIARAKGELLSGLDKDGIAVLNADDAHFPLWCECAAGRTIISFGTAAQATVRAALNDNEDSIVLNGEVIPLAVPGAHNKMNALAAAAAATALGLAPAQIAKGLAAYRGVGGRLMLSPLSDEVLLIDDTYNANPDSAAAALEVLVRVAARRNAVPLLIMGDMRALGETSAAEHRALVQACGACGVRVFGLGDDMRAALTEAGNGGDGFTEHAPLVEAVCELQRDLQNDKAALCVLVKGSRALQMERVVAELRQRFTSAADVNADAVKGRH